jgi:hypothetical protein
MNTKLWQHLHVAHMGDENVFRRIRDIRLGVLVLNRGRAELPTRIADIDNGTADVIADASMSLANPDLVERIKTNAPLNAPDPSTFFGGGTKGYTDYPTLAMTEHPRGGTAIASEADKRRPRGAPTARYFDNWRNSEQNITAPSREGVAGKEKDELACAIDYRTKAKPTGLSKTIVGLWQRGCTTTAPASSQ